MTVKRIALVSHSPLLTGGAELSILEIAKYLHAQAYSVTVVLPGKGEFSKKLRQLGIPFSIENYSWSVRTDQLPVSNVNDLEIYNADAILNAYRFLVRKRIELVITNTIVVPWFAYAAKALGIPNAMIVSEMHDQRNSLDLVPSNATYLKHLKFSVDHFFYNSNFTKGTYRQVFAGSSSSVLYPVVTLNAEAKAVIQNIIEPFAEPRLKIVIPGTVYGHKNQLELLEAAVLLQKTNVDFSITFVGSIGSNKYYRQLVKFINANGLKKRVTFSPFTTNIFVSLQNFDVAVIPSICEAFGRVTVESMLSGRLVIGSAAGATPELITDHKTGLLYQLGNTQSLANTLEWVANNRSAALHIARQAHSSAYKKFIETNSNSELAQVMSESPALMPPIIKDDKHYDFMHVLIARNLHVNDRINDYAQSLQESIALNQKLIVENSKLTQQIKVHPRKIVGKLLRNSGLR